MKLTKQTRRWIADALTNSENTSDQELRDHFIAEGLPMEVADQAIADRSFWEQNMVMAEIGEDYPLWYAGARPEVWTAPTR